MTITADELRITQLARAAIGDARAYASFAERARIRLSGHTTAGHLLPAHLSADSSTSAPTLVELVRRTLGGDGFTVAAGHGFGSPSEGYAVALPGTDWHPPVGVELARLGEFAQRLAPLADSGYLHYGGWRNPDGAFELNATVVFRRQFFGFAAAAAAAWDQISIWSLHDSTPIDIGGTGGTSFFDAHLV